MLWNTTRNIFSDICMLFYFPTTRNRCNPSSRCFYLDSQENAVKAGLSVKPSKHEKEITKK